MQKKTLIVIFGTLLLDMIGIGMIIPIIPFIFTDPSSPSFVLVGYSESAQYVIAGLVTALFGFMQFVAAPLLGELSDVYGRKRLLIVGVGVLAVSQVIFGFGIEIGSLALLFASRAIAGLAGANFSIAQASIADVTLPADRAKNFGIIGAAFGTGFMLGPALGGWIAHAANNAAAPFWFAGALGTFNVVFLSLFFKETHRHIKEKSSFHFLKGIHNIQAAFRDVDARPLYFTSFLYMSGFAFMMSFVGIFLVSRFEISESSLGTFFGLVGACVVITQLFILRILVARFNERAILAVSLLSLSFVILVFPFMPRMSFIYALLPILAVSQGLSMANIGALISKGVSPQKQGAALGINGSLIALSQGVIPLVAGIGSGLLGIWIPFLAGSVLVASAWSVLVFSRKR